MAQYGSWAQISIFTALSIVEIYKNTKKKFQ